MELKDIWNKFKVWIVLGVIALFVFSFFGSIVGGYNNLVVLRTEAQTQESQIETQMQRRADLVPNVVAATKGGMTQEKAVFESISKAYAAFQNAPSGSSDKLAAGDGLTAALRGYLVVVQQYPNLRSLDLVKDLTTTLEGSENRISVARQRYNESVRDYNNTRLSFPTVILANTFGFTEMKPFTAAPSAQTAPKVEL